MRTTFGRVPEGCNEIPRLEWSDRGGRPHREQLTPALDFNVAALWVTPSWIVLALTAEYEGGGEASRIAVWDLAAGSWRQTPVLVWTSSGRPVRVAPRPMDLLGGLSDAEVSERSGELFLRRGARTIVLWPRERAWSTAGP